MKFSRHHTLEEISEFISAEFEGNPDFVQLLHQVIAEYAGELPVFKKRASSREEGFLYVIVGPISGG